MKPIIRVENLSKLYRLGARQTAGTLRESLSAAARAPLRALRRAEPGPDETLWALRDVSFEVSPGDVVGVIGRNGAGKSTLLKILSRITEPTAGRVELYGRVGSLLEVGTGFHPELTGRENIFLNSAILGMTRQEIKKKFDEIVAFSEMERFLDTPVKRYSSGMYVRLAFAVAAHLDPEVLVIDEVLAVGDISFQNKCMGKMQDVSMAGRTVLFVSHNMAAISRLCNRAVLLESGRVAAEGGTGEVVSAYLEGALASGHTKEWGEVEAAPGTEELKLLSLSITDGGGHPVSTVSVGEPLRVRLTYRVAVPNLKFRCAVIFNTQGVCAFVSVEPTETVRAAPGVYESAVHVPAHLLTEGEYTLGVSIFSSKGVKQHFVRLQDVVSFHVYDPMTGASARGDFAERLAGVVRPHLQWELPSPA